MQGAFLDELHLRGPLNQRTIREALERAGLPRVLPMSRLRTTDFAISPDEFAMQRSMGVPSIPCFAEKTFTITQNAELPAEADELRGHDG